MERFGARRGRSRAKASVRLVFVPLGRMMMPRPVRSRFVTILGVVVMMRAPGQLVRHQRAAAVVPHDLPIGHAVARADRLAREVRRGAGLVPLPMPLMRTFV